MIDPEELKRRHPFSGRIRPLAGKTIRLFGSIFNPASPDGYIAPDRIVGEWQHHIRDDCECGAVVIQTSVTEILRSSTEPAALTPLPLVAYASPNSNLPAGATRAVGRSQVKLRLSAEISTIGRQWFQDAGQTIEVLADCVSVSYFAPSNFVEITAANETSTTIQAHGLVIDTQISVSICRLEQSIGIPSVAYTQNLFVPAESSLTIAVPPFATEVLIYENALGAASTAWTQWYADPAVTAGAVQAGLLPFIPGQRRTQQETLIPDVTHLQTDADLNADRFFTLLWTVRP
jgi:hypothetical protein